ncbi:MAG: zinc-dependent metalloprotease [Solirubrobacteraceae bacterium]
MDLIDWRAAQRIGELIAGSPSFGGVRADTVEPRALDFAALVSEYSRLPVDRPLPRLELVDRPGWIAANLATMRPMLAPLAEKMTQQNGPFAGPMRIVSGAMLGAQVGALTGVLSQRVLGQYDIALLDPAVAPRLLLVAPNLAAAASSLGVDRDELLLWVTIHEITHAVQFAGAPWLRDHVGGLLSELIDGLQVSMIGGAGRRKLPDQAELRDLLGRARTGQLLRLTLGEDRWRLVERMQATMSLIEGHAEHTMDAVGAEVLPSLPRLRAAMNRRRSQKGLPWRVLERLLGLELKMRQYEQGRRFCDLVVREIGPAGLAQAWSGPEALPTMAEIEQPELWLARTSGLAA